MTTLTATMPAPRRVINPARALRHSLSLAGRSIIRIRKNPENLLDVTIQPILFLVMFVFLFGGAISGKLAHSTCRRLVPGSDGAEHAVRQYGHGQRR